MRSSVPRRVRSARCVYHASVLTRVTVVCSLVLSDTPQHVPHLVCPFSCGWAPGGTGCLETASSEDVSWPTGSVPAGWGCRGSSQCWALSCLAGYTPRVEQSPDNGIVVIYTKNMTSSGPDTCAAAEQISPLKARPMGGGLYQEAAPRWLCTEDRRLLDGLQVNIFELCLHCPLPRWSPAELTVCLWGRG